ncbi:MAG: hypothetical protein CSA20_01215 [Deltaproteobacteria bacterium]|nr:MAG: hypothetical protein CSB32_00100 [Desulfobacterales bacterium]PIE73829.1 MAG: hypothetical protein CSA20_01215 [Deltaproteobacteria bacterium]
MEQDLLTALWPQVVLPVTRITFLIVLGLFVASCIESLNWTQKLACLSRPLIRLGHLSNITGASFSLAFFSGVSANTVLAETYDNNQLSRRELVLANLLNSLPRFFLHLPTVFFLTAPFIKLGAVIYVGLTFSGAALETLLVVVAGNLLLPKNQQEIYCSRTAEKTSIKEAVVNSCKRVKQKILRILKYMLPAYLLFFFLNWFGFFTLVKTQLVESGVLLGWLNPQAVGIVLLHLTVEFSAGLAAASTLLTSNTLTYHEVVIALLVGNILSTPIRALRHQYPYYTGIYKPKLALQLVIISQLTRTFCLSSVAVAYFLCTSKI